MALIGPNGAGKTTAFNVITGVYAAHQRRGLVPGEEDHRKPPPGQDEEALYRASTPGEYTQVLAPTPDKITKLGIARTFQNIRLWKSQTVFENVLIAKHCRVHAATCFRPPSA